MSLRINTNTTALNAHGNLKINDRRLSASIEKLSSGLRINRGADDAAGLTISEKLRTQIRGLKRVEMNVQDGISLIQTAEGALNEIHSMLQRMRELALQSGNDTLTTTDRLEIQKEVVQLKQEINRISYNTEFNTKKLLDGTGTAAISTSDNSNMQGVVTGQVLTFSDFSVCTWVKSEYIPGKGYVTYDGRAEQQRSAIFTTLDGNIASASTTLESIANFYDNNGTFILDQPQTLYIQGDNAQGRLVVSKDLTLTQLTERIQSAMTVEPLGGGLHFEGSTAHFSDTGTDNGQITVVSGRTGIVGRTNFTGNQDLIVALGFEHIVEAEDPVYSVTTTNIGIPAFARQTLSTQVAGNRAAGLIEGIGIVFQPPQSAKVISHEAELGITIKERILFSIADSLSGDGTNPVVGHPWIQVSVPAGQYSMKQVAEMIETQLAVAYGVPTNEQYLHCTLNDHYSLQFYSNNTGSAAYIKIKNAPDNELGITNGRYSGTGGGSASLIANGPNNGQIENFNFTTSMVQFSIFDNHGNWVSILLDQNFGTPKGVGDICKAINDQIIGGATPEPMFIRADVVNGVIQFHSTETGFDSGFSISSDATPPRRGLEGLGFNNGPWEAKGHVDGNNARQDFAFNKYATDWGWPVVSFADTDADDTLKFTVADRDGTTLNISLLAGSQGYSITRDDDGNITGYTASPPGESFVKASEIVTKINNAASEYGVKVHACVDDNNHGVKLVSDIPGKDGRFVITDASDPLSKNNLRSVLGIQPGTIDNGVGKTNFTMHIKDTSIQFQIGANQGQHMKCNIIRTDILALGIENLDLTTPVSAEIALGLVDRALQVVSSERAKLGAIENRMTYSMNSLAVAHENQTAAESRIRDVDMASEVIEMTRAQILQQASTAMVSQANVSAQTVLSLLQ